MADVHPRTRITWTARVVQRLVEEIERLTKGLGYRADAVWAIFCATQEMDPESTRNHQLLIRIQKSAVGFSRTAAGDASDERAEIPKGVGRAGACEACAAGLELERLLEKKKATG